MPLIQEDDTGREDENGGTSHYKVLICTISDMPSMKTLIRIVLRVLSETIERQDKWRFLV